MFAVLGFGGRKEHPVLQQCLGGEPAKRPTATQFLTSAYALYSLHCSSNINVQFTVHIEQFTVHIVQ